MIFTHVPWPYPLHSLRPPGDLTSLCPLPSHSKQQKRSPTPRPRLICPWWAFTVSPVIFLLCLRTSTFSALCQGNTLTSPFLNRIFWISLMPPSSSWPISPLSLSNFYERTVLNSLSAPPLDAFGAQPVAMWCIHGSWLLRMSKLLLALPYGPHRGFSDSQMPWAHLSASTPRHLFIFF